MVNTHSQNTNITDSGQSCKFFGIIDESECFTVIILLVSVKSKLSYPYNRVFRVTGVLVLY